MAELTKYDFFMSELTSLEKQIYKLVHNGEALRLENDSLVKRVKLLENENEVLKLRIEELENNSANLENAEGFDVDEKKALKIKIEELISKIDYHIRS